MKRLELVATVLTAVALIPWAIRSGDYLLFALPLLLPFARGLREGSI